MEELSKYDYPFIDTPIYHYTSASGFMGILASKTIWATDIFCLNDCAELVLAVRRIQHHIPGLKPYLPKDDVAFLDKFSEYLSEITQKFGAFQLNDFHKIFVISFSLEPDQLSQWRGYCAEGNGYSLGFKFIASLYNKAVNEQGFRLRKCIYTEAEHDEFVLLFLRHALEKFHNEQEVITNTDDATSCAALIARLDFLEYAPILKHEKFSEELEVRLISSPHKIKGEEIQCREGQSVLIPYLEIRLANESEPMPLSKVIIGPNLYPELAKSALRTLLLSKNIDCEIESSVIPYRGGRHRI